MELKEVVTVFVHECDEILHLHTSNDDIDTTTNHPFYVIGKGWVAAGDLNEGDELCLESGNTAVVTGTELEKLEEPIRVYNLEVADNNTYFVGDEAVLVHNYNPNGKKGGEAHQQKTQELKDELIAQGYQVDTEVMFGNYQEGYTGHKSKRFADVVAYVDDKIAKIFQIGKVNKNGLPVSRESKAIEDIMNSLDSKGTPITFVPYNSDIGNIDYMF